MRGERNIDIALKYLLVQDFPLLTFYLFNAHIIKEFFSTIKAKYIKKITCKILKNILK